MPTKDEVMLAIHAFTEAVERDEFARHTSDPRATTQFQNDCTQERSLAWQELQRVINKLFETTPAALLGAKGGKAKTEAKRSTAAENGRKGGRPKTKNK